jgi:hypothetical protein
MGFLGGYDFLESYMGFPCDEMVYSVVIWVSSLIVWVSSVFIWFRRWFYGFVGGYTSFL